MRDPDLGSRHTAELVEIRKRPIDTRSMTP
jgi:hypothetical protein